jgi:hypothetical protein
MTLLTQRTPSSREKLERRWNEALSAVQRIEHDIATVEARKPAPLGEAEYQKLRAIGADLARAWSHPDLVVRFGYGPAMPRSLRRPLNRVILGA